MIVLALLVIIAPISCALVLHWLNRTDQGREITITVELKLDGRVISESLTKLKRNGGGRTW